MATWVIAVVGIAMTAGTAAAQPLLNAFDETVMEGDAITFKILLSAESSQPVTVQYATANAVEKPWLSPSATSGRDFTAASGTLTFAPGETRKTVRVSTTSDSVYEWDERFEMKLSSPTNAWLGSSSTATGTITDDDSPPTVSVSDGSATEGSKVEFKVYLSAPTGRTVDVTLKPEVGPGDTAALLDDFDGRKWSIALGSETETPSIILPVITTDDDIDEKDETFTVRLSNVTNATLGDATGTGTIVDDDDATPPPPKDLPTVGILVDPNVVEGRYMTFYVLLSKSSDRQVSVQYKTSSGTAQSGTDFTPASGLLTFPAGDTGNSVFVQTARDLADEGNETFKLTLSNPIHATLGDATATATITETDTDVDGTPYVAVKASTDAVEGKSVTFTVRLSAPTNKQVTVQYETQERKCAILNGEARGCSAAKGGVDYVETSGTLTFSPHETKKTVSVSTIDDGEQEGNEYLKLKLSNPTNAVFRTLRVGYGDHHVEAKILDNDDPPPAPVVSFASQASNAQEDSGTHNVTVDLSPAPTSAITLNYNVGGTATSGTDYGLLPGTVSVLSDATSATIPVKIIDDSVEDGGETVVLTLTAGTDYQVGTNDTHTLTIQNHEPAVPTVSIARKAGTASSVTEGGKVAFTVTTDQAPSSPLTVSLEVSETQGSDFVAAGDEGTQDVTVPADATEVTFEVATANDEADEPDGSVTVTVKDGEGYTVGTSGSGTVAIADDDPTPTGVDPALIAEVKGHIAHFKARNHGAGVRDWTLILDRLEGQTGMTDANIAAWLARSRQYGWQDGIQTLPKVQAALAALEAAPDPQQQPASLPVVTIAADAASVTEGGNATFTLTATPPPSADLTVTVNVSAAGDYGIAAGSQTVTIPTAGSFTLTLATTGDTTDEPDGSVTVTVADGAGYTVGSSASGTVAVHDDDEPLPEVTVAAGDAVTEGGDAVFTLTASPLPASPLSVSVTVAASGDYGIAGASRTVTIPTAGSFTLTLATANDATDEPDGSATVTVKDGEGYTVGTSGSGTVAIADDDPTPTGVDPALVAEVKGHIAHFKARSHGAGVRDWTLVLDRLEGRTGMSDADIAAWLARSRLHGWQDGIQTLPKVQAALAALEAAPEPVQQPATLPVVTVAADAASVTEGGTAAFTLTATPPPPADLTVTVGVSATGDYGIAGASRTVTIPTAGSFTLTLATAGDTADEPDGSVTVTVNDGAGYTVGASASGTVAVQDDDDPQQQPVILPEVTIAAGASPVTEGGDAVFTLTASPLPVSPLAVSVTVAASGDYGIAGASRTVTIPTTGSFTLTLATTGDTADEPDGSVTVTVADGAGYTVGASASGTVAVRDDDEPLPVVTIAAGASPVTEGGDAVFTLTASPLPASPLAVTVTVAASGDYGIAGASRTVTIPTAGSFTLTLATADDSADEPDGSVTVTVADGAGYTVGASASGTVSVQDDDLPPPAVSITAAAASVAEGGAASFTVSADRAPDADLTVTLSVTEAAGGDHVAADDEGTATVTIAKDGTQAVFSVPTVDDAVDEPDGSVTVTLKDGDGYTVSSSRGAATVAVSDNDAAAGPVLSVADATVTEGDWAELMPFAVRLSAAAAQRVRVRASTRVSSPVSARPKEDYWPQSELVTFYPGETEKTVWVYIYNDSHDEDPETFEVVLSEADGATIGDGVAVGTIVNDDPMPAAWLARFGRTVAEQALDGIAGRMAAPRTAGMQGTLAGQALSFDAPADGNHTAAGSPAPGGTGALALADVARSFDNRADRFGNGGFGNAPGSLFGAGGAGGAGLTQSRTMTARDALLGSSFSLTGATDGSGGSMAFWGRAAQGSFDGREGTFSLDGAVTTGMLGADYARGKWLVGLALAQSEGEGDYRDSDVSPRPDGQTCPDGGDGPLCGDAVRAGDGSVEASLTAAIPYAALQASERLKLWGAAGYGTGEVTLKTAMGGSYKADTSWSMAAAGLRGDLLAPPAEGSGPALALTSDALWTRTSSEKTRDLAASDSDATRLRLGLEGSYRYALEGGGHLTPKLEIGARHDGGDAETGFGVELGGGIAWVDPGLGLSLDVSGRTLIAHGNDDLKDRGYAAALAFDPDPATQRGPSLSLRQEFGGQAKGGLDALFQPATLEDRTGSEATSRWAMEAAYGFPAFGGRWTGSPHAGLGLATGARDYSLGWRLTPEAANAPDVSFGLRATRRESGIADPEHTVGFEVNARW